MAMQPKQIRSFARGLAVLAALNRNGSASALTLARETGLPRATVYRLLQTLLDDGYVGRGTADDRFHLLLKVRCLSGGFEEWRNDSRREVKRLPMFRARLGFMRPSI
jgi:IclR family mhp operon transcriptional activator